MAESTKHLLARFYRHPVLDVERSKAEARKIEKHVIYVELRVKGDKNASYSRPMRDEDKLHFPDAWSRFDREGDIGKVVGISISMLPGVNPALEEELNEVGIRTISDMAELLDGHAIKIMDGLNLKRRAQAYLNRLAALSDPNELDYAAGLEQKVADLEAQLAAQHEPEPTTRKRRANG